MKMIKAEGERLNNLAKSIAGFFSIGLLVLGSGCSTMKVVPLTTSNATSYTQHEEKDGLIVGIRPMTDKREVEDMFKVNLLDKGLVPILVVAENQSPSANFIIAKNKLCVQNGATGTSNSSQRKKVTSSTGEVMANTGGVMVALGGFALPLLIVGMPIEFTGMQKASNASVIEFNLADKEFYSWTLGPDEKAQGFVYLQLPKDAPAAANYRLVAEVQNSATGEATTFDLPANLTLPK